MRIVLIQPKVTVTPVRLEADDVRVEIDRKTKAPKVDERQLPVIKELGTTSVQEGESKHVEYPATNGVRVQNIAMKGDDKLALASGEPMLVDIFCTDGRVRVLRWKEAEGVLAEWKVATRLTDFVLPSQLE